MRRPRRSGAAALLCLLLAACASAPRQPLPAVPANLPTMPAPAPPPGPAGGAERISPAQPAPQPRTLWQRIRGHLALPGCDADPRIVPTARDLVGDPQQFERMLSAARPLIALVQATVEAAGIPADFTLIPLVESDYRPDAVGPGGFVGLWQFDRGTALAAGMPLLPGYDGRRDPWIASVRATRMLARYGRELGDWRLVVLAFNQGEWGVRHLLQRYGPPGPRPLLADWPLSAGARTYLLRLYAYGCIVRRPQRFGVTLPPAVPPADLWLARLAAPLRLDLAARLAGLPPGRVRSLNAGYRRTGMPPGAPWHLLLPRTTRARFETRYAMLAPTQWEQLARYRLRRGDSLQELLRSTPQARAPWPDALATVNGIDPTTALARGRVLWLPDSLPVAAMAGVARFHAAPTQPRWHTVRTGDSLWSLAQRYHLSVTDLREWNHLRGDGLRIGQRLRLRAPG